MFIVRTKTDKKYMGGSTYRAGTRRRWVDSIDEAHVFKNKNGAIMAMTNGFGKHHKNAKSLKEVDLIEVSITEENIVEW